MKFTIKKNSKFILNFAVVIFFVCYHLLSTILALPDILSAIVGTAAILMIPCLVGQCLLSLWNNNKQEPSNFDNITKVLLFWAVGAIFSFSLVNVVWAIGIRDLWVNIFIILILILIGAFIDSNSFALPNLSFKKKLATIVIFLGILIAGLSSTCFFRLYQPFPSYLTNEFSYFGRAVQLIDSSPQFQIAEKSSYVIFSVLLSLGSAVSNTNPVAIMWISAFAQSAIIASSMFLLTKLLFQRTVPALISSFLVMWVFGTGSTQNNPAIVTNDTIQFAFFLMALYAITLFLKKKTFSLNTKILPIIFFIPLIIILQRIAFGYENVLLTLIILVAITSLFVILRRQILFESKYSFSWLLLLIFILISILNPYMAPLYIFDIAVFVFLWKYLFAKGNNIGFLFAGIIIIGLVAFFILQHSQLLTFTDNFTLSKYLFGSTYDNVIGVNVSFSDKLGLFLAGNPPIIRIALIIGAFLLTIQSIITKNKTGIILVAMSAVTFIVFFFPESWFIRARHLIPFFVLVIGGGSATMITIFEKLFTMPASNFKRLGRSPKCISILLTVIIFVPVLYESTVPFRTLLDPWIISDEQFITFEPYEYTANEWLRQNLSLNERNNLLILSDPYTINLMTAMSGLKAPYKKAWVLEEEYSTEDLQKMISLRSEFFNGADILDQANFLETLLDETSTSAALIVINGRTTKWLSGGKMFVWSDKGIPYKLDLNYVESFSATFFVDPIYTLTDKLYIFKLEKATVANFDYTPVEVIADDDQSLKRKWIPEADGTGVIGSPILSDDSLSTVTGSNSLKWNSAKGNFSNSGILLNFLQTENCSQNWSSMNCLGFYWYGTNSSQKIGMLLGTISDSYRDSYKWIIEENWVGWKLVVCSLRKPTSIRGAPDCSQVTRIAFWSYDNSSGTKWLDYVTVGILK